MMAWVKRIAPTSLPVLVQGESGCGKERVARALHRLSRRGGGPFVPINCSALTESLLDAELFGAVRGAYTGSDRDRPGLFRQAHGGTLFLDEIGDMPTMMQAKLLRALESNRIRPVGGVEETEVEVRIVAATHRNLQREARNGRFRADLFYRIAVLRVSVPPLRDRLDDLPELVRDLLPRLCRQTGKLSFRLTADAWSKLRGHHWPGNVRELHSVLARAMLRADGDRIRARHLEPLGEPTEPGAGLERDMIEIALREAGGRVTPAAARIGWTRQKLYRRMKLYGLGGTMSSESSTFQ